VIRILKDVNAGSDIFAKNLRNEARSMSGWQSRLDFDQLIIAGHSYGATGALQALKPSKARPAIGGIILDPGKDSGRFNTDIDVPILVVHSNSWSSSYTIFFGSPHFDTVRNLVSDVLKRVGSSWFITSLGTSHPSVTDAPLIEPLLLSWTTGATINVKEGLREYVRVSMEFIDYLKNGRREGVLAQDVTHPQYNDDQRTDEQKRNEPKNIAKYWQIHLAPDKN
jgi:platelet-activating factor acetylhydrolase